MSSISWTPIVFVRYSIFLVLGILIQIFYPLDLVIWAIILLAASTIYLILLFLLNNHQKFLYQNVFGLIGLVFLSGVGGFLTYQRTDINNSSHISNFRGSILWYRGAVDSEVLPRKKTYKTEFKITKVKTKNGWKKATGRVMIFIPKNDAIAKFEYGDELLIKGMPLEIPAPANPGDFDFKTYSAHHNIYHQQFIRIYKTLNSDQGNPIIALSLKLRKYCNDNFRRNIRGDKEYGIVSALVLGIKNDLDQEIKEAYANAGVMHILAVSGMHVALIFQMLLISLGRLKQLKYGKLLFAVFTLLLIWLFAFVTGLSASVLRAVVMFTFIIIGEVSGRQRSVYNGLFLSAFALLIYDPHLIMDVGFQLSYIAVLGIIYLYPKIYRLLEVKNKWLDDYWKIVSVSLAAQIVVSPMSIYYFHQFPTYFLIANILLVPLTNIAMRIGIGLIAIAESPQIAEFVGVILEYVIWFANVSVIQIKNLPFSVVPNIRLNGFETACIYSLIVLVLVLLKTRKLQYLKYTLLICLFFSMSKTYATIKKSNTSSITIFKGSDKIEFNNRGKFLPNDSFKNQVVIKDLAELKLFLWNGKCCGVVESPIPAFNYKTDRKVSIDLLIIRQNSIHNLEKLSQVFDLKMVVIDDCNSWKTKASIERSCRMLNLKCHSIYEKGAFQLTFNHPRHKL